MKILFLEEYYKEFLPKDFRYEYKFFLDDDLQMIKEFDYEVIFSRLGMKIDENFVSKFRNLKFISTPTTGYTHIDLDCLDKNSIELISLKKEKEFLKNITTTAEHAWMLFLISKRDFIQSQENIKKGFWKRSNLFVNQLTGSTAFIIGFGRLGKIISRYAQAFNMKVKIYDPNIRKSDVPDGIDLVELSEGLKSSRNIFLCASYTKNKDKSSSYILNRKYIDEIQRYSTIVNISRGELIDQDYLFDVKQSKDLKLCFDVLTSDSEWNESEINAKIKTYYNDKNVLLTPHYGGFAIDAINATRKFIFNKTLEKIEK